MLRGPECFESRGLAPVFPNLFGRTSTPHHGRRPRPERRTVTAFGHQVAPRGAPRSDRHRVRNRVLVTATARRLLLRRSWPCWFLGGRRLWFRRTIERRLGDKFAKGLSRVMRSSHAHVVNVSGGRFRLLLSPRPVVQGLGMPYMTVLCPAAQHHEGAGLEMLQGRPLVAWEGGVCGRSP